MAMVVEGEKGVKEEVKEGKVEVPVKPKEVNGYKRGSYRGKGGRNIWWYLLNGLKSMVFRTYSTSHPQIREGSWTIYRA